MEASNIRRRDTTKGPPCRVLSLDGGGVRGYSIFILLQELMHRTFVEIEGRAPKPGELPKPCDHFDLIAGTGTGGLIAIMLGRLRLDLETCKQVYIRMTRKVFITDKTIGGIPYTKTLFKASKLEEAIKECVREHTISEEEGNDGSTSLPEQQNYAPSTPMSNRSSSISLPQRTLSRSSNVSGFTPSYQPSLAAWRWGNPNASLYDLRENRTKTAVTAVYKGTPKNGNPALLRSYDSRKEPSPEVNCTIWQAGRATSATGLAFKPIQIGQSIFIDEGAGKYNPAPHILDEAAINEWPGRDIGVFVSIGTGRRPKEPAAQQTLWWESFVAGGMGDFAEARRRLISKIEGCEETHQYMLKEHLAKRGVNPANYYRINVDVGVGDYGMNEWNALADISTSTHRYLAKNEVQRIYVDCATKMGRIHKARMRHPNFNGSAQPYNDRPLPSVPPPQGMAIELPGEDPPNRPSTLTPRPPRYPGTYDDQDKYSVEPFNTEEKYTVFSADSPSTPPDTEKYTVLPPDDYPQAIPGPPPGSAPQSKLSNPPPLPRRSNELAATSRPPSARPSGEYNAYAPPRSSASSLHNERRNSPRRSGENVNKDTYNGGPITPPPRPPKTPLPYPEDTDPRSVVQGRVAARPPYPDEDGPPPVVDRARKPTYGR